MFHVARVKAMISPAGRCRRARDRRRGARASGKARPAGDWPARRSEVDGAALELPVAVAARVEPLLAAAELLGSLDLGGLAAPLLGFCEGALRGGGQIGPGCARVVGHGRSFPFLWALIYRALRQRPRIRPCP